MASYKVVSLKIAMFKLNAAKAFHVVDASGIMNSRSLNLPQKVFLKGFYPQNIFQEFSLSAFEKEDVILATSKFRIIECINENDEKIPALKILLNDLVRFNIDPSDIPKFPIMINMTAVVQEPSITKNDDTVTI
ncbi:13960_t:CDS:2, partial [Cetraspora pellucida]